MTTPIFPPAAARDRHAWLTPCAATITVTDKPRKLGADLDAQRRARARWDALWLDGSPPIVQFAGPGPNRRRFLPSILSSLARFARG